MVKLKGILRRKSVLSSNGDDTGQSISSTILSGTNRFAFAGSRADHLVDGKSWFGQNKRSSADAEAEYARMQQAHYLEQEALIQQAEERRIRQAEEDERHKHEMEERRRQRIEQDKIRVAEMERQRRINAERQRQAEEERQRQAEQERQNKRQQNASAANVRYVRGLIREKYRLDIYVWSMKDVQIEDREVIQIDCTKADTILTEIYAIVMDWEEDLFQPDDWKVAGKIKEGLILGRSKHAMWGKMPPWDPRWAQKE